MSHRLAWSAASLILLVTVGALVGALLADQADAGFQGITSLAFASVGSYVGLRAPTNPVGWLIAISGLLMSLGAFCGAYAMAGLPGAEWAALVASLIWLPSIVALVVGVPLLFPDGRLVGPRWRWLLWTTLAGWLFFWAGNAFEGVLLDEYGLVNPMELAVPTSLIQTFQALGPLLLAVSVGGGVSSALIRFRNSRGVVRLQMKWFLTAACILIPALIVMGWAYESGRPELAVAVFTVGALGIPISLGIAILRYRLYEIDRVISRTVTYATVVGLLAGAVALVALTTGVQFQEPWVVAATTLGVAAVFNPVRKRVQFWVDRRFNRSHYDAEHLIEDFAGSLRSRVDPEGVVDGWVGVVSETMQPSTLSVWLRR